MGALAAAGPKQWDNLPAERSAPREQDIAAIGIGSEIVMIDTSDYVLDGRVLAVVCRWNGEIALEYPKSADGRFWAGARSAYHPVTPSVASRVSEAHGCVVLGRVISRN